MGDASEEAAGRRCRGGQTTPPGRAPTRNSTKQAPARAGARRRGHCAAAARPAGSPKSLLPGRCRPQKGATGRRGRGRCRHQRRRCARVPRTIAPSPDATAEAPAGTRPAAAGRPHRPPSSPSPRVGRRASPLGQSARRSPHLLCPPSPPNQTRVNGTLSRVRKRGGGRGPAPRCGQPAHPCNDGCAGTQVDPELGELPTARGPPPTRPPTGSPARTEATGRDGGGRRGKGKSAENRLPPRRTPPPQCDAPATRGPPAPPSRAPPGERPLRLEHLPPLLIVRREPAVRPPPPTSDSPACHQ
ncbi:hypothetical protein I4F81_005054 [Pyropia yezoensis]|uniref:Uncharacterized protein n=1 Tax=Pyropia yezoensis TaxID=2788 RepID=A0ACC3BWS1_PYRYE|nr:hypothetical protein I4F81_005054 [Neopyropia yezoensis]